MKQKKRKIAFVYDAIYPYIKGGAERRYYEIGKRLAGDGYDVHLYGMKLWQGPSVIKNDGITVHGICSAKNLYTSTGRRSIFQAVYFGFSCLKLLREDFDIIDCCGFPYFSLFSCKLICFLKKKKLYSTWHEVWGQDYWKEYLGPLSDYGFFIEKIAVQMPDVIISVSKITAEKIRNELHFKKRIELSHNGIDFHPINSIKPSSATSDVIYAGRLMNFKHIDILIRAISLLKKENPKIKGIIIGDGPERSKLEKLVEHLDLEKNVRFLGFLPEHDDVYAYLKSSKVFVLPSTREGFGIVVLEANACGIPVVTVKSVGNVSSELITDGINGVISQLDSASIAKQIKSILSHKNAQRNDKKTFIKKYDWNIIGKNIQSIYSI